MPDFNLPLRRKVSELVSISPLTPVEEVCPKTMARFANPMVNPVVAVLRKPRRCNFIAVAFSLAGLSGHHLSGVFWLDRDID
ncbi:MAG TPA: hypothetical protein VFO46_11040 [Candidatus Sulfotelmatobacter sp.]|nr:hypothetical protein [Candidatus Sulfotelmatobacter sp.]